VAPIDTIMGRSLSKGVKEESGGPLARFHHAVLDELGLKRSFRGELCGLNEELA
jgi:hypothetical protein